VDITHKKGNTRRMKLEIELLLIFSRKLLDWDVSYQKP